MRLLYPIPSQSTKRNPDSLACRENPTCDRSLQYWESNRCTKVLSADFSRVCGLYSVPYNINLLDNCAYIINLGKAKSVVRSRSSGVKGDLSSLYLVFFMGATQENEEPIIFAPETYQYERSQLDESQVDPDPINQFAQWFSEAQSDPAETLPESLTLATAELPSGRVSARVLLLKELDKRGFVVFSNWGTSHKAHDIETNPYVCINFFWKTMERQVRVEGITERVDRVITEKYFKTRPRGSQVGAWTSPQSQVVPSRQALDDLAKKNAERFANVPEVPCPDYWGGIRIVPLTIEFWQGRPSRLHDRIVYRRVSEGEPWEIVRLAP